MTKLTTAQRNKLDAERFRKLLAIIEASATKVATIGLGGGREIIVSKEAFGQIDHATVTIRQPRIGASE